MPKTPSSVRLRAPKRRNKENAVPDEYFDEISSIDSFSDSVNQTTKRKQLMTFPSNTPIRNITKTSFYRAALGLQNRSNTLTPMKFVARTTPNRSSISMNPKYVSTNAELVRSNMAHNEYKKKSLVQMKVLKQKTAFLSKLMAAMKTQEDARKEEELKIKPVKISPSKEKKMLRDAQAIQELKEELNKEKTTQEILKKQLLQVQEENRILIDENTQIQQMNEELKANETINLNNSQMEVLEFESTKEACLEKITELREQRNEYRSKAKRLTLELAKTKRQLQLSHAERRELKESIREELQTLRAELFEYSLE